MNTFNTNDEHDILTRMYELMEDNVNAAGKAELETLQAKYPELYAETQEDIDMLTRFGDEDGIIVEEHTGEHIVLETPRIPLPAYKDCNDLYVAFYAADGCGYIKSSGDSDNA
jgi:hypothetical protein